MKILVCSRYNNIRIRIKLEDGETIEQVEDFVLYLGSTIRLDGRCKKEIIKRICQAKAAFYKKINIFIKKTLTLILGRIY